MIITSYNQAITFFILIVATGLSCNEAYSPKPRGFFRIDFPEKTYQKLDIPCPFSFEYPVYAQIERKSREEMDSCWLNVDYLPFNGRLHLTYKVIDGNLPQYLEDSRNLAYKHVVRASGIEEQVVHQDPDVYGIIYKIEGNTASSLQFHLTDNVNHFIRGSLYFNVQSGGDSLAPVYQFIRSDIIHMINTFRWGE